MAKSQHYVLLEWVQITIMSRIYDIRILKLVFEERHMESQKVH